MTFTCRICSNQNDVSSYELREMLYGTRETFEYFECSACGVIQICEIPNDLGKYYPSDYTPFNPQIKFSRKIGVRFLTRLATNFFIDDKDWLGKLAARALAVRTPGFEEAFPYYLRDNLLKIKKNSKILDFGAAAGSVLRILEYYGFTQLTGADKYIGKEVNWGTDVTILNKDLPDFEAEAFDLVMLHHVFEHVPDPTATLKEINRLLPKNRFCLIRIPIINDAWERYGHNWFQLDPPRHLHSFTEDAFITLAERTGFVVDKVIYDSTKEQFVYSELYRNDVALIEATPTKIKASFKEEQLKLWDLEARTLNNAGKGDQACFYLRKI